MYIVTFFLRAACFNDFHRSTCLSITFACFTRSACSSRNCLDRWYTIFSSFTICDVALVANSCASLNVVNWGTLAVGVVLLFVLLVLLPLGVVIDDGADGDGNANAAAAVSCATVMFFSSSSSSLSSALLDDDDLRSAAAMPRSAVTFDSICTRVCMINRRNRSFSNRCWISCF